MEGLLTALAIVVAIWLALIVVLVLAGRGTAARELATLVPNLLILFRGLIADRRVPRRAKLLLAFATLWIASPIDLVPEFIPVAGPLDDAIVAALVLRYVLRTSGPDVLAEHWRGDPATLRAILRIAGIRTTP